MIDLSPEQITNLEKLLGLPFVNQPTTEGNLCFVNDREVRPEFKETFNCDDVIHYMKGFRHSQPGSGNHFQLPADRIQFWKMVEQGRKIQ